MQRGHAKPGREQGQGFSAAEQASRLGVPRWPQTRQTLQAAHPAARPQRPQRPRPHRLGRLQPPRRRRWCAPRARRAAGACGACPARQRQQAVRPDGAIVAGGRALRGGPPVVGHGRQAALVDPRSELCPPAADPTARRSPRGGWPRPARAAQRRQWRRGPPRGGDPNSRGRGRRRVALAGPTLPTPCATAPTWWGCVGGSAVAHAAALCIARQRARMLSNPRSLPKYHTCPLRVGAAPSCPLPPPPFPLPPVSTARVASSHAPRGGRGASMCRAVRTTASPGTRCTSERAALRRSATSYRGPAGEGHGRLHWFAAMPRSLVLALANKLSCVLEGHRQGPCVLYAWSCLSERSPGGSRTKAGRRRPPLAGEAGGGGMSEWRLFARRQCSHWQAGSSRIVGAAPGKLPARAGSLSRLATHGVRADACVHLATHQHGRHGKAPAALLRGGGCRPPKAAVTVAGAAVAAARMAPPVGRGAAHRGPGGRLVAPPQGARPRQRRGPGAQPARNCSAGRAAAVWRCGRGQGWSLPGAGAHLPRRGVKWRASGAEGSVQAQHAGGNAVRGGLVGDGSRR